jgi:translation initiation factor IF-1
MMADPADRVTVIEGIVRQVLDDGSVEVQLDNGRCINAGISGRIKVRFLRVREGDLVRCELSPYDPLKARIIEFS